MLQKPVKTRLQEVGSVSCSVGITVTIAVDFKKNRLRIHKYTLGHLGNPDYLQLLVNPKGMQIAIYGDDQKTRDGHRVNLKKLTPDNSYELYSKALFIQLRRLIPLLDAECTYRLTGNILQKENIALFPLSTLQKIEVVEENN